MTFWVGNTLKVSLKCAYGVAKPTGSEFAAAAAFPPFFLFFLFFFWGGAGDT